MVCVMGALIDTIPAGARILDARFRLADPSAGKKLYLEGHIPGAYFVDLETQMTGRKTGRNGRHPFPDRKVFADMLGKQLGIGAETSVVIYDDADYAGAARLWMMLRWVGHEKVWVLNGGLKGYAGELAKGEEPHPPLARFLARKSLVENFTWNELGGKLLVDARAPERFRGEVEPIDSVGGHIPGARNFFYQNLLHEGRLDPSRLPTFEGKPTFYCGSGVTASVLLLAAAERGMEASLYAGSWSEWCVVRPQDIAKGEK
ncbi:MAG: sulfurtransferase [Bacteriovoracia bacterium]